MKLAFDDLDSVMVNPTGKKVVEGTLAVTAGTLPTTFTPTSLTVSDKAPFFRLDN